MLRLEALMGDVLVRLTVVALAFFWCLQGLSWAQPAPAELPPEKAKQFLQLLCRTRQDETENSYVIVFAIDF